MPTPPYTPQLNSEGNWYPKGPGNGFGYYSGHLFPEAVCESEAEAAALCNLLNRAYREGSKDRVIAIKQALGI